MNIDNKTKRDNKPKLSPGRMAVRALDSIVDFAALAMFLVLLFFGIYAVWDTNQVQTSADSNVYKIYKPTVTDTRTFDDFKALNSDVFGWLSVYGTNIDYPLLQSDNNEKYLNTSADGKYSLAGSIFLDYRNSNDFSDFNSIIHGHHMAGDVMFGEIGYFKDEGYFEEHKYGALYYGGEYHGIDFFAFLEVDAYDSTVFKPPLTDESSREEYLQLIKDRAVNYRDLGVTSEDHIVLLATCTTAITNGRHLLVGVIRDDVREDGFALEQESTEKIVEQNFSSSISSGQWLILIVILLFVLALTLIIVILIVKRKKKSREGTETNEKIQS